MTTLFVALASTAFVQVSPPDDVVTRGGGIYQATCAACHGTSGLGGVGTGVEGGPPLVGLPVAYFDQVLRTGRMPIAHPPVGVVREQLDDEQREMLLAYAVAELDAEGALPVVGPGDSGRGRNLFVRNCAACHGASATGGIVGGGTVAPRLNTADPVAVAEAIRVGPFEMPAFDDGVFDDQQVDDVIAYLDTVDRAPRTLLGLREVNDVIAALAAVGLTVAVVLVVRRLGIEEFPEPEDVA